MRIAHWAATNTSGMAHMAAACAEGERRLGHESVLVDVDAAGTWLSGVAVEADVHVCHTRFPDIQRARVRNHTGKEAKVVFVAHGIPEHNMEIAVNAALGPEQYCPADHWMLTRHWLRVSDAFVVFNERQQAIYQTMVPKAQTIDCVPMGVDRAFWAVGEADGERMRGQPSVWMSENQARIKWALDVLIAWPWVAKELPQAFLHAHYLPFDMHRFLIDLANTNGAAYYATLSARTFSHETLRTMWKRTDFNLATTRYGDNTLLTMQAESAGLATISYPGNQYASYWVPEGDQRVLAQELVKIFSGDVAPRAKLDVPDLLDTAKAMTGIYERVLDAARHSVSVPLQLVRQEDVA